MGPRVNSDTFLDLVICIWCVLSSIMWVSKYNTKTNVAYATFSKENASDE